MKTNLIDVVNSAKIAKIMYESPMIHVSEIRVEQVKPDEQIENRIHCYTPDGGVITIDTDVNELQPIQHGPWTKYTFGQLKLLVA